MGVDPEEASKKKNGDFKKQIGKGGSSDEIHYQTTYLHMRKACVAYVGHCFGAD
jgi:hypothetical protein